MRIPHRVVALPWYMDTATWPAITVKSFGVVFRVSPRDLV
jgi:hypothetical protein